MLRFSLAFCLIFAASAGCTDKADVPSETASSAASANETLEQVERLMAVDRVEAAEKLLREAVENHPSNGQLRYTLARVLAFDGRVDDAVELLKESITDDTERTTKLNLLILAGQLSLQRAEDGPTVTHRRGIVVYGPKNPDIDKTAFVRMHLAVAEASFGEAMRVDPDKLEIMNYLAQTLTLAGKSQAAIELWSKLLDRNPRDREATVQLASLRFKGDQPDVAIKLLKDVLEEFPNDSEVLTLLVKHYQITNNSEAIEYWTRRRDFSNRIPQFSHMEYSEENFGQLDSLASRERVEELLEQKTTESSELLAVYCWTHPHNDLEDRAFVELGDRGENQLLQGLMDQAASTCTIRGAAAQLARSKPPDLFDRLAHMLPGDRRAAGMDMDIANAMDVLGDARAVPALISVLAPDYEDNRDPEVLIDLDGARHRAAIALGGFDTDESKQALRNGLSNPSISLACTGALYRLSGDEQYLAELEKAASQDSFHAWLVLEPLTVKLPEDQTLKTMLTKLEQRLKQKRKEDAN
jgi:tetratricopeptide (TPR) repeat protein